VLLAFLDHAARDTVVLFPIQYSESHRRWS
jgi:hypothetical protein